MKAIKRAYAASGGVNIEELSELFYGSLEEREALAEAITNKGVPTEVSNTLDTIIENVKKIPGYEVQSGSISGSQGQGDYTKTITFPKAFSATPIVMLNTSSYGFYIQNISVSKTAVSFTLRMNTTGTRDYSLTWKAVAIDLVS